MTERFTHLDKDNETWMIDIRINQGGKNWDIYLLVEGKEHTHKKTQQSDILIGQGQFNCSSAGKKITWILTSMIIHEYYPVSMSLSIKITVPGCTLGGTDRCTPTVHRSVPPNVHLGTVKMKWNKEIKCISTHYMFVNQNAFRKDRFFHQVKEA